MKREARGRSVPVEIREAEDEVRIVGYAAVFDEEADIGGYFREVIRRGAFQGAINRDDIPFLINHDGLPLARRKAGQGTLQLTEDDKGLRMETVLDPNDPDVRSILPKMRRGDLDKMSFAFTTIRQAWSEAEDPPLRELFELRLYDVSIVTTPAYEGTDIGMRGLEEHRAQRKHNARAATKRIRRRMCVNLAQREIGLNLGK